MLLNILNKRSGTVILFLSLFLNFQTVLFALPVENNNEGEWKTIESEYCTVYVPPEADIDRLNRKLKVDFYDIVFGKKNFSLQRTAEGKFAGKFDSLLERTKKILDMYPRKIHLKIKIYRDQAELDEAYSEVLGCKNTGRKISWYVHRFTTIYTSQKVLSANIIAHEMGHAVVDHYFLILPPESIEEMLAQYVEVHLND